jgi:hypothetical protein
MSAGDDLERSLLKGMNDSCAAVFFITPNYIDDNFLATEVDYAIAEKRKDSVFRLSRWRCRRMASRILKSHRSLKNTSGNRQKATWRDISRLLKRYL